MLYPNFNDQEMPPYHLSGISSRFQLLSQADGQIAYVLLTRSPLPLEDKSSSKRSTCMY